MSGTHDGNGPGVAPLPPPVWTRAVVGDMLADPISPLGWTMLWWPSFAGGLRDLLVRRLGFDSDELARRQLLRVIGGYLYLDATPLRVWGRRAPSVGPLAVDRLLQADHQPLPRLDHERGRRSDPVAAAQLAQWSRWVHETRRQTELDGLEAEVARICATRPRFDDLSDAQLLERAIDLQPLCRQMFDQHLNQTLAAFVGLPVIDEICQQVGQPAHALRLISGLGGVASVGPAHDLWDLSRQVRESPVLTGIFDRGAGNVRRILQLTGAPAATSMTEDIDRFLSESGFRGPSEWDLSSPTWDDAPDLVVAMIDSLRRSDDEADPRHRRRHLADDRRRLMDEIAEVLDDRDRPRFDQALRATSTFLRGRDRSRTGLIQMIHEMRLPLRALARRGVRRGEFSTEDRIWMLTAEELGRWVDGALASTRSVTDDRHRQTMTEIGPAPAGLHLEGETPAEPVRVPADLGAVMIGRPGSPGMATAPARVIGADDDLSRIRPGEVLVLTHPDLVATPLFVSAAAVVIERGRTYSHAAVVARELGIPLVVGAAGAVDRIDTGDLVNVDGLTGVVSVADSQRW